MSAERLLTAREKPDENSSISILERTVYIDSLVVVAVGRARSSSITQAVYVNSLGMQVRTAYLSSGQARLGRGWRAVQRSAASALLWPDPGLYARQTQAHGR